MKRLAYAALALLTTAAGPADFQARVLAEHNRARAAVGAPPLAWNNRLSSDAIAWGMTLARERRWEHDGNNDDEGENLWMGTAGAFTVEEMIGSWAGERRDYRPGVFPNIARPGRSWHDVGHYTQMIWARTTEVGCGLVRGDGSDYLVCRYSPPGNVMGARIP